MIVEDIDDKDDIVEGRKLYENPRTDETDPNSIYETIDLIPILSGNYGLNSYFKYIVRI